MSAYLPPKDRVEVVTIESGDSLQQGYIDGTERRVVAIAMPAAWTTAGITILSTPGIPKTGLPTWYPVYDSSGSEMEISAAAGRWVVLDPRDTASFRFVRLRSGTAAAAVDQAADREVTVVMRPT